MKRIVKITEFIAVAIIKPQELASIFKIAGWGISVKYIQVCFWGR